MSDVGYQWDGRGNLLHRVLDRLAVIKTRAATLRRCLRRGESVSAQSVNEHLDEIDRQVDEAASLVRLIRDSDPSVAT
jgi:hypothetical protein